MSRALNRKADGNYPIGNGPKLPINQSQFEAIKAEIRAVIGQPGEKEALEHWEGPDTGLDISVDGKDVSIRVASTHCIDANGDVVRK